MQSHLNLARKLRAVPTKLDLVAAWCDTSAVFAPCECIALTRMETLTILARAADHGVGDHEYDAVPEHSSRTEVAFLITTITNIQAWNHTVVAIRSTSQAPTAVTAE